MKNSLNKSEAASLRHKAEEEAMKRLSIKNLLPSVPEMLKLIEELEIHQVELEMQNEELVNALSAAKDAIDQYDYCCDPYYRSNDSLACRSDYRCFTCS